MQGLAFEYSNDTNIYDYFLQSILNNPEILERNAIYFKEKCLTFNELYREARRIRYVLVDKLTKLDSRIIGVHLEPDENTIPILLAILSLDCCYLPIDPSMPEKRIEYILKDSKLKIIITNSPEEKFQNLNEDIFILNINRYDLNIHPFKDSSFLPIQEEKEKIACILYTSGSTGHPKGVCISHRNIMNRLEWQWKTFEISSEAKDIGAFKTSLNFVDHIAEIFAFILKGLPIVVIESGLLKKSLCN